MMCNTFCMGDAFLLLFRQGYVILKVSGHFDFPEKK